MLQLDGYIAEAEDLEREAAIFHNSRIPKSLVLDRRDFCRQLETPPINQSKINGLDLFSAEKDQTNKLI